MSMRSLKKIREEYNSLQTTAKKEITQKALAKKIGISTSTMSKLESGTRKPTDIDLLTYSRTFGVSLEYILDDKVQAKKSAYALTSRSLGLNDAAIDAIKAVKEMSSKEYEIISVLNAFLGNGENTVVFFSNVFKYFADSKADTEISINNDAFMAASIMSYLEKCVKPLLEQEIQRYKLYMEDENSLSDEEKYGGDWSLDSDNNSEVKVTVVPVNKISEN